MPTMALPRSEWTAYTSADKRQRWHPKDYVHRTHLHLSPYPIGDERCQSGMRHENVNVDGEKMPVDGMVKVDLGLAGRMGCHFLMSYTGAILTRDTVPDACIQGIWMKHGDDRKLEYLRPSLDPLVVSTAARFVEDGTVMEVRDADDLPSDIDYNMSIIMHNKYWKMTFYCRL